MDGMVEEIAALFEAKWKRKSADAAGERAPTSGVMSQPAQGQVVAESTVKLIAPQYRTPAVSSWQMTGSRLWSRPLEMRARPAE